MRRKIKRRRRTFKKERKDISSNQSEDSDSPVPINDAFDFHVKVRQTSHALEANISLNGKNQFSNSEITKAQPNLTEESRSGMYSTKDTAKICLSGYLKCMFPEKYMFTRSLLINSRLDCDGIHLSILLYLWLASWCLLF